MIFLKYLKNFLYWLTDFRASKFFWEDGRVMIVVVIVTGMLLELISWKFVKATQLKWILFVPTIICFIVGIIGLVMLFFPNGTGGYTQHFYLCLFMYSLSTMIVTIIVGVFLLKMYM